MAADPAVLPLLPLLLLLAAVEGLRVEACIGAPALPPMLLLPAAALLPVLLLLLLHCHLPPLASPLPAAESPAYPFFLQDPFLGFVKSK